MLNALSCLMHSFKNDDRGVTALEYGLIASLVAIAIVTAVTTFGTNLAAEFTYIGGKI